jgi:hypothetical protein
MSLLSKMLARCQGCGRVLLRCLPAPINRVSLLTGVQAGPVVTRGTLVRIASFELPRSEDGHK